MNEQRDHEFVQHSIDTGLSSIQGDPWLAQRIIASEKVGKPVKKIRFFALVMAAVVLLSGIAVAYAITRPAVLNWLLGYDQAGDSLEQSAQEIIAENSADHITARINGIVYDGERFAFSYELENDQPDSPAMVLLDSHILINGQEEGLESTDASTVDPKLVPDTRLDILPVRRNPTDGGGWSLPISQELSGEVACEITFIVYRPVKGFVVLSDPEDGIYHLDEYDQETQAEIKDSWDTLRNFKNTTIAKATDNDPDQWSQAGYTVIDAGGMTQNSSWDETTLYNMRETARMTVTFHFNTDAKDVYVFSDTAGIGLSDCTLRVHNIRFSPLRTVVNISLIPGENSQEAAQELVDRYGRMDMLDEHGEPVQYAAMDYMYNSAPWATEHWEDNDHWACTYMIDMPGLQVWPESISLVTEQGEILSLKIGK